MKNKSKNTLLEIYQKNLKSYKEQLAKKPNSIFYQGLVKNMEELIKEYIKK